MNDDQARWIASGLDNISDSVLNAHTADHQDGLAAIALGLSQIAGAINRLADAIED